MKVAFRKNNILLRYTFLLITCSNGVPGICIVSPNDLMALLNSAWCVRRPYCSLVRPRMRQDGGPIERQLPPRGFCGRISLIWHTHYGCQVGGRFLNVRFRTLKLQNITMVKSDRIMCIFTALDILCNIRSQFIPDETASCVKITVK